MSQPSLGAAGRGGSLLEAQHPCSLLEPKWVPLPSSSEGPLPWPAFWGGGGVSPLTSFNYTPMIMIASSAAQGGSSPSENALSVFNARNKV